MKQLLILVLIITSGCTSTSKKAPQAPNQTEQQESTETGDAAATDAAANKLVCYREKEVGSHFSRKICKTRGQREADRKAAEDLMDRSRSHEASQVSGEQ